MNRTYQLTYINANDVIASKSVMASHYLGKQRYRQLMCQSGAEDEDKKNFDIQLPCMETSPIIEESGDGGEKSYHLLANVYVRYQEVYQKVLAEIDTMLAYAAPELLYEYLFFMEMHDRRGFDYAILNQRYSEYGEVADEELFRHLMMSFLIPAELAKEAEGTQICEAMAILKQSYCDSLDSAEHRLLKLKICGDNGCSSIDRVDNIIKWHHCETRPDRIDYRKSPYIEVRLMVSKPSLSRKEDEQSKLLLIPGTNQIIWTKMCIGNVPVTSFSQFESSVLEREGSLFQSIRLITPTVCWCEEENKKAVIQFKARVCDILVMTTPLYSEKRATIRCTECECLISGRLCVTCSGPICYGCQRGPDATKCYKCDIPKKETLNVSLFVGFSIFILAILIKCFV